MRKDPLTTLILAVAVVLVLGSIVTAGAWWAKGGRWFNIETPSMGAAAPVGTLIITRPASVDDLNPGDIEAGHTAILGGELQTSSSEPRLTAPLRCSVGGGR